MPRFILKDTPHETVIYDQIAHCNFAFIAQGMMGVHSNYHALAEKVVEFMNTLPILPTLNQREK